VRVNLVWDITEKFTLDPLGGHVNTCTTPSGSRRVHDWTVEQLPDFFRTRRKVKTQQEAKQLGSGVSDVWTLS
jgi:hypothetical protein